MVDSATQLGRIIGGLANNQSSIQENLSPDDVNAQYTTVNSEQVKVNGTLTATKKTLATDAFILDHPIQGELDSSVYKLDGGYSESGVILYVDGSFSYPGNYEGGDVVLFTVNF